MKTKIGYLKINQKLLVSYIVIIVIPIALLSFVSYKYFIKHMESKVIQSVEEVNAQAMNNLDSMCKSVAKITEVPFYNTEIQAILSKDYTSSSQSEYEQIEDQSKVVDVFFRDLFLLNDYIDSIMLYPKNREHFYRKGFNQTINYDYSPWDEAWYKEIIEADGKGVVTDIHRELQATPGKDFVITVGRLIVNPFDTNKKLGTFLINIKAERLKELISQTKLTENTQQLILDRKNAVVYSSKKMEIGSSIETGLLYSIDGKAGYTKQVLNGENVLVLCNISSYTAWKIITVIPQEELFSEINIIKNLIFIICFVLVLVSVLVSFFIARGISLPIRKLSKTMNLVENGNLDVKIETPKNDELGHLGKTFNLMISKIKILMEEKIEEEKQKRMAELNALQCQINPHFMYNTINAIKWKAQIQGHENLVADLQAFSSLLNFVTKANEELIRIEQEIDFIKNYIEMLSLRYFDKFDTEYDINPEILKYRTIKFLLQPFIENAIFHGFGGDKNKYTLKIVACQESNSIIYRIIDNGIGIEKERIESISDIDNARSRSFNSIGISNVIQRIRQRFGNEYGVRIDSTLGQGTTIIINIPIIAEGEVPCKK